MCGINVVKNLIGQAVDPSDLRRMCSVIEHRGPDGGGYALLDQGTLGMSHVRLSVIDLATGAQPLSSSDGQVTIVFNGELYDYQQHREALIKRGHRFRTTSDTEVLLNLYLEHGLDRFDELNGEFAFVIWDARMCRLVAVRDRFGVKPLYYHKTDNELFFASEIKSLYTLQRIHRQFHPDYFVSGYFGTFTPQTHLYQDIYSLPPGHYVRIERGVWVSPKPYWTPTFATDFSMTVEDAIEGVRDRLTQAISRRMVADVAVGSYLSGGIDSTIVCGVMSQLSNKVHSFNIGFENPDYDESKLSRQIAGYFGSQFETVHCNSDRLASSFESTVWHVEQPLLNPNSIAKNILSKLVRERGYKVCLTGEGSDELFGGYAYFKQELLWEMEDSPEREVVKRAQTLLKKFYRLERRSESHHWSREIKGREPLPGYLKRANFYYSRMKSNQKFVNLLYNRRFLETVSVRSPLEYFEKTFDTAQLKSLHGFNASKLMTYQNLSQYIFPCVGDRVDMANSVETRVPFLDPELVEFASRIPPQYFVDIETLREKNLLRLGFSKLMPPFMQTEHKHPFMSPSWHALGQTKSGRDLFNSLLDWRVVKDVGIFRQSFVAIARFLWAILPHRSPLWQKIDVAMGQICSIHLLHQIMLRSPDKGDPLFPLTRSMPS